MPVGPSHSGRGGGGPHGGGGGFGGPRGGGPRHDPHHGPRPSASSSFVNGMIGGMIGASIANRRRERFEQRYGVRPNDDEMSTLPTRSKPVGFLILAIFTAVILFFSVIAKIATKETINDYSETVAIMETDWKEDYKPMLDEVKDDDFENGDDNYYLITATFTKLKHNYYSDNPTTPGAYLDITENNVNYYFIVYEYTFGGKEYIGTTYTSFSANQIDSLNGRILIAVYDKDDKHFSINTSYKLEDCIEYRYYLDEIDANKSTSKGLTIAIVIEVLVLALFITLYVMKIKKYYKLVAADEELLFQKKKAETAKATAEANAAASRLNRYCKYCGCKIDADSNVCSSCGAKLTK